MIHVNDNFSLGSKGFLDSRQSVADLDELLTLNTNTIPDGFEVYIENLDIKYRYNSNYNETDTGHWKLMISEGEGVTIDDENIKPNATWSSTKIKDELDNVFDNLKEYDSFIKLTGTMGYHHYAREFSYSDIQTVFDTGNTNSPGYGLTLEKVESNQTNLITALTRVETIKDKKFTCSGTTSIDLMQNGILHFSSQDFEQPYEMLIEWNNPLIDDENISTETTWSSEKIFIETAENYAIFEGVIGDSYYSTNIGNDDITSTPASLYGGWTLNTVTSNGDIESILSNYNNATTKRVISFSDILRVYDISDTSISLEDTTKNSGGQPYKFILVWENDSKELGSKTYTTLDELGLTAPVTVGDIFNAMPDKTMAIISCEGKEGNTDGAVVHVSDVPVSYGVLTIKKNEKGRFSIEYQNSLQGSPCNVKKWIGTLKGDDGTGLYWKEVVYKDNIAIYRSLSELGLDTTATLKDITRAMAKNSMIAIKVDAMANQSEYNNITQGTVTIYKIEDARIQAIMTEKSTGRTWVGILGGENTIIGWKELRSDSPFYRIVTQGVAGYFKFKPTPNGIDQPLRISVTDNYGGMINISGATPSTTQYKPFKCIRLSNGTYADYDAIKTTNNKMEKLYFYDGYFYLKIVAYTTCTGLVSYR